MPFLSHLEELRRHLIKSILAIILLTAAAGYFSDYLFEYLLRPLGDTELFVTEVTGSFYAYMKVSIISGVIAAMPVVFYQLWSFISPGLYRNERRLVLPVVFSATLLFLAGAAFSYFVVLPLALQVLIGFAGEMLTPIITVDSYISFAAMLLMAFGFGFELPILAFILGKFGLVSAEWLSRGRRYAVVIILILSAVLTPADVFTMVLLAIPLYILFEVSIVVVRLTGRRG